MARQEPFCKISVHRFSAAQDLFAQSRSLSAVEALNRSGLKYVTGAGFPEAMENHWTITRVRARRRRECQEPAVTNNEDRPSQSDYTDRTSDDSETEGGLSRHTQTKPVPPHLSRAKSMPRLISRHRAHNSKTHLFPTNTPGSQPKVFP